MMWGPKWNLGWLLLLTLGSAELSYGLGRKLQPDLSDAGRLNLEGLDVYRLSGSSADIGYQAGHFAPLPSRNDGMPRYMAAFLNFFAEAIPLTRGKSWMMPLVDRYFEFQYYRHFKKNISPEDLTTLSQLARGLEYSSSEVEKMFMNPDVAHMVIAEHWDKTESEYHSLATELVSHSFGCTSFVSGLDGRGEMLVGRTFDYSGVGHHDKYPAVFFVARDGKFRFVTMGSAGTLPAVIHGMNEHGLVLAQQNAFTQGMNKFEGNSIFSINRRIMEEAKSIEEAHTICNQDMPATSWIVVLADTVTGVPRAARLEVDPVERKCHLFKPEANAPFLVTTNFFQTEEAKRVELDLGPGVNMDLQNRYHSARHHLLNALDEKGEVTVEDAVRLMGSRYSWELKRRGAFLPGSISVKEQIGTFIVKPMTREFWIANGRAPTNSRGKYVHFSFDDFENVSWNDFSKKMENRLSTQDIETYPILHESGDALDLWPAAEPFLKAYVAMENRKTIEALKHMEDAVSLSPHEPIYWLARGFFRFKAEEFVGALADFKAVMGSTLLNPYRQQLGRIFYAKTLDALGERQEAIQQYQLLYKDPQTYSKIAQAAKKYTSSAFKRSEAQWLSPNLQFMTVFQH